MALVVTILGCVALEYSDRLIAGPHIFMMLCL